MITRYPYNRRQRGKRRGRLVFAALFVVFLAGGAMAAVNIITLQASYAGARREYDLLRQYAPAGILVHAASSAPPVSPDGASSSSPAARPAASPGIVSAGPSPSPSEDPGPAPNLAEINPDYAGWIVVDGAWVNYPIVLGDDNEKYLTTTFTGETNPSGTIFMDVRCRDSFDGPVVILYGHNMKDGSMFAGLNRLLKVPLATEYRSATVVTAREKRLIYRVVAAYITDVSDPVYALPDRGTETAARYMAGLGVSENARLLALSTCTYGDNPDERLLVLATEEFY